MFLNLVECCKMRPNLQSVVNVHALALKAGVLAHLPASTSLVMAYSRGGDYASSVAVLDGIKFDSLTLVIVVSAVSRTTIRLACLELIHSLGCKEQFAFGL
ncbi:hypothetical protein HanRHA438_Chr13g0608621 [Helianthus annuus]|nr:hypothetical protein HanRHA438_Chr13g0608621 [Helianthus annuus]